MIECKYCGEFASIKKGSVKNHEYRCPKNPSRIIQTGGLGKTPWNKGLTKETSSLLAEHTAKRKGRKLPKDHFSPNGLRKLSLLAKERGLGGYRPHPNKGSWYKGIYFDSMWEVLVAESLDKHFVRWERPKQGFVWNELGKKYYPDFFLPDYNVYLDPKNPFLMKVDREKIEESQKRNKIRVILLTEEQLNWESIYAAIVQ